jgi:hypothetical protein
MVPISLGWPNIVDDNRFVIGGRLGRVDRLGEAREMIKLYRRGEKKIWNNVKVIRY